MTEPSRYELVYAIVRQIPEGRIATYGQVATYVQGVGPRQVGYAMAALQPGTDVPWQRVINAKGEVSPRLAGEGHHHQRTLLEQEGVTFDARSRTSFKDYGWDGPDPQWLVENGYDLEDFLTGDQN